MKHVWVVTESDYDSTELIGVFSSEEKANEARAFFGKDAPWDIERLEVDELCAKVERGLLPFLVLFPQGGENPHCSLRSHEQDEPMQIRHYPARPGWAEFSVDLWAKSEADAIAIATEARAKWLTDSREAK